MGEINRISILQIPNSHPLNHHIIVASLIEKGSRTRKAIRIRGWLFFVNILSKAEKVAYLPFRTAAAWAWVSTNP
jgi:hypothetical protein